MPIGTEISIAELAEMAHIPPTSSGFYYCQLKGALEKVIKDDGRFRIDFSKQKELSRQLPFCVKFTFLRRGQSIHAKETKIAKDFAKKNELHGISFVCYYDVTTCIFLPTDPPGRRVDPVFPPPYIIVNEYNAQWATKKESESIFDYMLHSKEMVL